MTIDYPMFKLTFFEQFRLFCRHPVSKAREEKRLEVHKDTLLSDTVALAHKVRTSVHRSV